MDQEPNTTLKKSTLRNATRTRYSKDTLVGFQFPKIKTLFKT